MTPRAGKSSRNPLALGWEAARANAIPAFCLQAAMLAILVAYYMRRHEQQRSTVSPNTNARMV